MGTRHLKMICLSLALGMGAGPGCTRNPATGKLVFNTMKESEELEFGEEIAEELEDAVDEYEDAELSAYVTKIGDKMATVSERPDLPWKFKVLDSWVPNAFAIAGGRIYVTRGLLALMSTEAELAAVLGHEVGHIAALHSAQSVSRKRARSGGILGARGRLTRNLGQRREFAHSREQEHEADRLGLRYLENAGYDPRAASEAIAALEAYAPVLGERLERERMLRLTPKERKKYEESKEHEEHEDEEEPVLPAWKKSHPDSDDRILRLRTGAEGKKGTVKRDEYLAKIDGIIYGHDPREGFFLGDRLVYPEAGITMDIPEGWIAMSNGEALIAMERDRDEEDRGLMIMIMTDHERVIAAYDEFFEEFPFDKGARWERDLGDSRSIVVGIGGVVYPDNLVGFAGFSKMKGRVFAVIAIAPGPRWRRIGEAAFASFSSLRILREQELINTQPVRLRIQQRDSPTALKQLGAASDGAIRSEESAALNQVAVGDDLPAGPTKVVVGNWPDLPAQIPQ